MKVKINPNTASLNGINKPSISVTPNPTNGQLFIDLTLLKGELTMKVLDVYGRMVHLLHCQGNQLLEFNFDGQAGMYFLIAESDHNQFVVKFMKK